MFSSLNTEATVALIVFAQVLVTGAYDLAKSYLRRPKTAAEAKAIETKATSEAKAAEAAVEGLKVQYVERLITSTERFADFVNSLIIQRDSQESKIAELQRDSLSKEVRISHLEQQGKEKDEKIAALEKAIADKEAQIADLEDTYQKKIANLEKTAKENEQALAKALDDLRKLRDQDLKQLEAVKAENARLKLELDQLKSEGEKALMPLASDLRS